jgi:uncharacterized repeat protein (TIGR01451 family)
MCFCSKRELLQQLNIGDTLNVTITAQNNGIANADVRVNDTLPPGAKLIRGETSSKQILKSGGGSMSINYTLQMNREGEIKMPACKANFFDLAKNSGEVNSNTSLVHVGSQISLEGNRTKTEGIIKTEGKNESSQAENNSSDLVRTGGTKEENGITPGFDFLPSLIGFLAVIGFLRQRIA